MSVLSPAPVRSGTKPTPSLPLNNLYSLALQGGHPIPELPIQASQPRARVGFEMNGYVVTLPIEKQNISRKNQSDMRLKNLFPVYVAQQNRVKRAVGCHSRESDRRIVYLDSIKFATNCRKVVDMQIGKIARRFCVFLV